MSDYADYQSARDREYLQAWENLPQSEKERLRKAGISGPEAPAYQTRKPDSEPTLAKATAEIAAAEPEPDFSADLMEVLRRILGELMAQDNVRLTLECLALVTGLSYRGNSMKEIGKRHAVTRAAVSKRCVDITDAIGLPPSLAMRKLTARTAYERRQRRVLHRNDQFSDSVQ